MLVTRDEPIGVFEFQGTSKKVIIKILKGGFKSPFFEEKITPSVKPGDFYFQNFPDEVCV